jgi:hypothetical protein
MDHTKVLEILDSRLQLLIHLLQSAALGVSHLYQVVPRIDEFASFVILDKSLFRQPAQEDLRNCTLYDQCLRILHFRNLGDIAIGISMITLIQRYDSGKLGVDECLDDEFNGCLGPFWQRFFQCELVKDAIDN